MDYNLLLDLATDLGYRLAICGAETFRIEDSISRLLTTYGIQSETFAIPNCITVSIETPDGIPLTRMRRIGHHGNDLDGVEKYNSVCRAICNRKPEPKEALEWLKITDSHRVSYNLPVYLAGNFLGAAGFALFFGGDAVDMLCAGFCGILVGIVNKIVGKLQTNEFFSTITAAFIMAIPAYLMQAFGICHHVDTVIIGALMILVPGLLFTNAMRDIIFGDTNSGINRIVQVFLIAAAIALGTGAAWNLASILWGTPVDLKPIAHGFFIQEIACLIGCVGFAILFNVHGPGGILCAIGGILTWGVYLICFEIFNQEIISYFFASVTAAVYSEIMARIRKYPAISYLVVAIFPLLPGAGVYYTMNHAVRGDMQSFADQGMHTIAIAGIMAVGILMVSTLVRIRTELKRKKTAGTH